MVIGGCVIFTVTKQQENDHAVDEGVWTHYGQYTQYEEKTSGH